MVRCRSKYGHQIGIICLKEIGLRARNLLTILGSIVNNNSQDLHGHLMSSRMFTLIMNKVFVWAPEIMRKMAMATI